MSNLHHNPRTRAFTLTELLVVIAIVVLLLGTLFVAINAASKRAQVAKTQFLMNTRNLIEVLFKEFSYDEQVLLVAASDN